MILLNSAMVWLLLHKLNIYTLWTIYFDEIYKQHASIIDLNLRKISINLLV